MAYQENVKTLCERLGIEYPPREKDCLIDQISVTECLSGEKHTVFIDGLNFIGPLYFQEKFSNRGYKAGKVSINPQFKRELSDFYAEEWKNAGSEEAPLISLLEPTYAISIEIIWNSNDLEWIEDWNA